MPAGPFLRWAGGKRQLLPILIPALPADFDLAQHRFFEPFVGGGAVMFRLSGHRSASHLPTAPRNKRSRSLVVNDVNHDLTTTYRVLQDRLEELIAALRLLAADTTEKRYYEVRAIVPADDIERAARMIYLNRLSFNGLYRVNSSGGFNVPFGKLKSPTVLDEPLLRACAAWLQHIEVRNGSFESSVTDVKSGDVIYLDPPYIPLSATSSFSKYAKDDFREMDQYALAGVIRGLSHRGARVILSNSNTELTRKIFGTELDLYAVDVTRTISASAAARGSVEEVIGVNFPLSDMADPSILASARKVA